MSELDPDDVAIGQSSDTMERRALMLLGRVRDTGFTGFQSTLKTGLPRVCERSTRPLPYGCWSRADYSPYALYGNERWCDACIAYAALNGTLPRPEVTIELSRCAKIEAA